MNTHSSSAHSAGTPMGERHYARLGAMMALSFIAMYVLMYAMVDSVDNVYMNFNQVYMAGLMAAPMVLIELALMRGMYRNRRLNMAIAAGAVFVAMAFFMFIRRQSAIGDRQFLRSMIPHHASAILMCQQAGMQAAEIKELCFRPNGIIESQTAEIAKMKELLAGRQQ